MINESEIRLLNERKVGLKTLSGFRKHHRVPAKGETVSEKFLIDLVEGDLNDDLDDTFAKLRSGFGFKRRELAATEPIENFGEIRTPGFTYEVSANVIEDDAANVLWRCAISRITDAESVTCPQFEQTFGKQFNMLELILESPISVEDVIDEVEDCEDSSIKIAYEKEATWCRIEFAGRKESIHVEADSIRVISTAEISPSELIDLFLTAHAQFFSVAR